MICDKQVPIDNNCFIEYAMEYVLALCYELWSGIFW